MADLYGDALQEDLAVYSFDALDESQLLGASEADLAHLLDEGLNELNDETFGADDLADGPSSQPPGPSSPSPPPLRLTISSHSPLPCPPFPCPLWCLEQTCTLTPHRPRL